MISPPLKIEVFHPQLEGFQHAQPGAVLERRDQAGEAVQWGQDCLHLIARHHDRQSLRLAGLHHSFDTVQRLFQHVLIKEQNRRQSLVLRRGSHVFLDGQMRQETVDVAFGHLARMPAVVKEEEVANPVEVGFLGTPAVMPGSQDFHHPVIKPRSRLARKEPQR